MKVPYFSKEEIGRQISYYSKTGGLLSRIYI